MTLSYPLRFFAFIKPGINAVANVLKTEQVIFPLITTVKVIAGAKTIKSQIYASAIGFTASPLSTSASMRSKPSFISSVTMFFTTVSEGCVASHISAIDT